MSAVYCRKDMFLSEDEKEVFSAHLSREGLAGNIWDLFEEWVKRSTPEVSFFYLKVYVDEKLAGLGLFVGIDPFDLRASYAGLRKNVHLRRVARGLSALTRNCVYLSFRNLITSNITRPFFIREPEMEDVVMKAILSWLRKDRDADMITIVDTKAHDGMYGAGGFLAYLSPSEAWFDVSEYEDISEYLDNHRSLKKNLRKKRNLVVTEIRQGPLSAPDIGQIRACMACSVEHSRISNPCQAFFEENIFGTDVFQSDKYVHVVVRVDDTIAGFHTFLVSGSAMGGVLGGFNRAYSRGNYVYERVIVSSLDYAIRNRLKRLHYSLIDNFTKLRLVDLREPCALYFYSRNPLNRNVFKYTYKFNDIYQLHLLEAHGGNKG